MSQRSRAPLRHECASTLHCPGAQASTFCPDCASCPISYRNGRHSTKPIASSRRASPRVLARERSRRDESCLITAIMKSDHDINPQFSDLHSAAAAPWPDRQKSNWQGSASAGYVIPLTTRRAAGCALNQSKIDRSSIRPGLISKVDTNDTKSMARDIISIPKRAMSHVAEGNGRFSCASSVLLLRQA